MPTVMQSAANRQIEFVGVLATAAVVTGLLLVPIEYAPAVLAVAGAAALLATWCTTGNLLPGTAAWFVLVICFDEEFWRASIPGFFSLTLARILIVVLGAAWLGMWLLGRTRLRTAGPLPLMIAILLYFSASAALSGFKTVAVASVHYRLIGGYWFAFAMFFYLLHAIRGENDIRRLLVFFCGVGAYLAFTGWCEHFEYWSLVFPRYIADPTVGIHWGRVRGPFVVSATMGTAMTFCLLANLLLARRVTLPWRLPIVALSLFMLPPLFWTQTRSVWLGGLAAGAVWIGFSRQRRSRTASVALLAALAIVVLTVNFENFRSSRRDRGGVADVEPVYLRMGLALITLDMFKDAPIFGVGFGHFRDMAPRYARDVASPLYAFASPAMEHNNFLSVLADTGLLGLGLYVGLLAALFRLSLRLYRRLPRDGDGLIGRDTVVVYWALMAVFVIDGMFRETSVHPFTNSLFFGVSGIIAAMDWLTREQPSPPTASRPAPRDGPVAGCPAVAGLGPAA